MLHLLKMCNECITNSFNVLVAYLRSFNNERFTVIANKMQSIIY